MDKTVVKAFRLLERLAQSETPRGITALGEELELGKSNVHRLLSTLAGLGYVRNVGDGRYEATLRLWEMGTYAVSHNDIRSVAAPYLAELVAATGETAHLSVLSDAEVIYIDKIDGEHPVRAYSRIGGRAPAHAVATGKALLAFKSTDAISTLAATATRYTDKTLTGDELVQELSRVKREGVAFNYGEWREGVCGIAAPVRDSDRVVVAAMGISGPVERMKADTMESWVNVIREKAMAVSRALGYIK